MKYKKGDRFIIEIDRELPTTAELYKIKGFNALVFDNSGLGRLEQVHGHDGCDGCEYVSKYQIKGFKTEGGFDYPCNMCKQNYKDRWTPKVEDIQVGDEVENKLLVSRKAVVYQISGANLCVVRKRDGELVLTLWSKDSCTRTGKTYPELIKALKELP